VQPEHNVQNEIRLGLAGTGVKLFRNNVGTAWTGDVMRLKDGSILIRKPRPFHAGLSEGSGDLIGWRTVTVTPEMVGEQLAVFASVEVKAANGRLRNLQKDWLQSVRQAGGLACVAKNLSDAKKGLALECKAALQL
jgi:hypothetical protein